MNKTEKLIAVLLGCFLAFWFVREYRVQKAAMIAAQEEAAKKAAEDPKEENSAKAPETAVQEEKKPVAPPPPEEPAKPKAPETVAVLTNDLVSVEVSSYGAAVKSVTLLKYARGEGEVSPENPPVVLSYADAPLFAITTVDGIAPDADWELVSQTATNATFKSAIGVRTIGLGEKYAITLDETFADGVKSGENVLSLGAMHLGDGNNDMLSIDSKRISADGSKAEVVHYDEDDSLKSYLVAGVGGCGGCGASGSDKMPNSGNVKITGRQIWIALKNRFFVTALVDAGADNTGFATSIERDTASQTFRPKSVAVGAVFDKLEKKRSFTVYAGPKEQSSLWDLGMKDVMEFGMWRWVCYPMVAILKFFHAIIPNYGVAIILLTILVRIVFWPLTRKSTISMRKMSEVQPKIKALQEQFKDNPQRMQQEVWAVYRENKVNPMAGCLPMLVQIPVFIALFTVLRSAVELRYASFLWISDLSEPEALFASWFPFGGLNILPILMAATMALQSYLTPSAGDKSQQKMMMVFMPIMMLVMFYNFPSALSLYWTLSQVISIIQMWRIRKTTPQAAPAAGEADVARVTRQMRRHGNGQA